MNYKETISWLYAQFPAYQKEGSVAYKKDIVRITRFFEKHGKAYQNFQIIHVGGTNGKGSVSHMLSSVLQESGFSVGLFPSPHLLDFRERIKINGAKINKKFIIDFVENHMQDFVNMQLSFFEINVAIAYKYFATKFVDIAIVEVGLGGRLDATNVISPLLSIITNISLDHINLLGNSLKLIAREKAGIIKKGKPILIGEKNDSSSIFEDQSKKMNAELFYSKQFNYSSDLQGEYQQYNINTCVTAIEILNKYGFIISHNFIRKGLKKVSSNTGILGRWQIISKQPLVICDIAHNIAAIKFIMNQLSLYECQKNIIIGFSKDKSLEQICEILPKDYFYFLCGSVNPRIINPNELSHLFNQHKLNYAIYDYAYSAYDAIIQKNELNNLIMITGSTFIVSDILKYLDKS